MDKWAKSTFGISAAALFVLFASNGEKFGASLQACFNFLVLLTAKANLGVWAFLLALAIAVAAQGWFGRLVTLRCSESRAAIQNGIGFVFGFGTMYVQMRTTNGMLLAILIGFAAPFAYQFTAAGVRLLQRKDPDA